MVMAKKDQTENERIIELLEKLLILQLLQRGATQQTIARYLGRAKAWVNESVQGLPEIES